MMPTRSRFKPGNTVAIEASVREQLPRRADALLTLRSSAAEDADVPAFDAESIDALHALARRESAA